jgi:hypothetical protein
MPSRVRSFLSVPVLALFACVACSSGGGGDLDPQQMLERDVDRELNEQQTKTPIAKANNPEAPLTRYCGTMCIPGLPCQQECPSLKAKGVVVVAVDNYDETRDGKSIGAIYVQDAIQPTDWSGLMLYRPHPNPSDLHLIPGSGVDVGGMYQPFPGPAPGYFQTPIVLPELVEGSVTLAFESPAPEPVDITVDMLRKDKVGSMKYVGRLVRIKDVEISSPGFYTRSGEKRAMDGEGAIDGGTDAKNAIVSLSSQFLPIQDPTGIAAAKGKKYSSVTGILNFFYNYKLCPRFVSDAVPVPPATP